MTAISVILVTGGIYFHETAAGRSAEILHTNGSRLCSLTNLPSFRYLHSQTGYTLCGGGLYGSATWTSCLTFTSGSWEETHTLDRERFAHSAWASPRGIMLLGGWGSKTSTEILMESGDTNPGFNLDYRTA